MKKIKILISLLLMAVIFTSLTIMSNPNCPTGYTTAPGLNSTTTRNCTSCHGDYSLNTAGGGITVTGLPQSYTAGQAYPFTVKITHSAANRTVWGMSIKAVDTLTHAVIGTWTTTNPNTSIKGTPTIANGNYELSHANAATSTATNTYTYSNLTWTAPAVPTAVQARVKFYVSAIAGNNNGNEAGDYAYSTSLTSNRYVAPTPCTFTYGAWTTCSNGTQTRSYTTSPAGCTGTPPADSITRTCTVVPPTGLPTPVTIVGTTQPGICDTIRTFTVAQQSNVNYTWAITGVGNYITNGQNTNTLTAVVKAAGIVYVSLSNTTGSIPASSLSITRALPPTPSALNGSLAPCPNSSFTYSVTNPTPTATQVAVARVRWVTPLGSTITSANADSSQITLQFNTAFVGGTLAAKNETACGTFGTAKSITLSPAKALDYVSSTGFLNFCIGSSANFYVVTPLASTTPSVTVYRWTKPAFTTIVSANGDSSVISLQFNTGYKGGALAVRSSTSCGTLGTAVSKTLTHLNCAAGQRGSAIEILAVDQFAIYPNPNNGNFKLNIQTDRKLSGLVNVNIHDMTGRLVGTYKLQNNNGLIQTNIYNEFLKSGIYLVSYTIDGVTNKTKMVIQK